ncbi:hypothetical protein QN277_016142 [Acacia crassicarpa]|uniref:Uncharacterized protein n=1 Tax=Acacia crassicarpa TaxID=499986 RepID=A0AAE1MW24_9FABA|nr:hypothetical protein QN277_016142 [Acacia crassicarpa]
MMLLKKKECWRVWMIEATHSLPWGGSRRVLTGAIPAIQLLSDEDLALKQQLELYVERLQDPDPGLQKVALESMR